MIPLPWTQLMRFGFGQLRLSSAQFWAMTLPEMAAALDARVPATAHPDRAAFDALARRFPDTKRKEDA